MELEKKIKKEIVEPDVIIVAPKEEPPYTGGGGYSGGGGGGGSYRDNMGGDRFNRNYQR